MKDVKKLLDGLTDEQAREALQLQQRLNTLDYQNKSQNTFIPFVKHMWPDFIEGEHHKRISDVTTWCIYVSKFTWL